MHLNKTKSILIVCLGYFLWICIDTILMVNNKPKFAIVTLKYSAINLIGGMLFSPLLILSQMKILERYSSKRRAIILLVLASALSFSIILALITILNTAYWNANYAFHLKHVFILILTLLPKVLALFGLFYVFYYSSHNAYQKEQVAKTKALADEAQLLMLRYQINPHFLFNSLNAIQAMIEKDKERAKEMIADISDFFRYTLSKNNETLVPLKEEIDAVKKYLAIQKDRFANRIEIDYKIEDPSLNIMLPFFIIHPLIENAIKYGFSSNIDVLRLLIQVTLSDQTVTILVKNNGSLNQTEQNSGNGVISTKTGIENIKKRLELFYPNRSSFELFEKDYCVHALIKITNPDMPA